MPPLPCITSRSRVDALGPKLLAQAREVAIEYRLHRRVDRSRHTAFVLAILRQNGMARRDIGVGPEPAHDLDGAPFVRRIDVAVQEVDDDGLAALGQQLASPPRPRPPRRAASAPCRRHPCAPALRGAPRGRSSAGTCPAGRRAAAVRRPSSSTSRKPLVVINPTLAILRSSSALVVVVVPCTTACSTAGSRLAEASAAMKPIAWLSTVVGTLASFTSRVSGSIASRSVKVPPTSMPTVKLLLGDMLKPIGTVHATRRRLSARPSSRRSGSGPSR